MKAQNTCLLSQPATQIHAPLVKNGDFTVFRARGSAFSRPTTTYDPSPSALTGYLEEFGIRHLVLTGVATSGVVLSTVREAWDQDYAITVLEDGCWDTDDVSATLSFFASSTSIGRGYCAG